MTVYAITDTKKGRTGIAPVFKLGPEQPEQPERPEQLLVTPPVFGVVFGVYVYHIMHKRYVTKTVHVQCCQRTTDLRCANPWHANVNYKWLCIASACTAVFVCHAAPCTHKNRHNNDSKIPVQIRHLSCHQNVLPKSANLFRNTVTVQRQLNNEKLIKYATKTTTLINHDNDTSGNCFGQRTFGRHYV